MRNYSLNAQATRSLYGLHIPFLPDFLLDHTLLGKEFEHRIVEHRKRWSQFVSGLWRDSQDVTYLLGFDFDPNVGKIETSLIGRRHSPTQTNQLSQSNDFLIWEDLDHMLEAFGFEPRRMSASELEAFQNQFDDQQACFEIHQEEVRTPIREISSNSSPSTEPEAISLPSEFVEGKELNWSIYNIRPWWGSDSTFLLPFHTLTTQHDRVSIRVLLAPTLLTVVEKQLIAEMARESESLSQRPTRALEYEINNIPTKNRIDPQLRWEAKIYAANLRRLSHPFLTSILCFSKNSAACHQVALAIASTLREEKASDPPLGESEFIPSGATIKSIPCHDARSACEKLDLKVLHRRNSAPDDDLDRLRYLMDARGAASAFRFPVSVRGGIPGINVKQRPPDFHPGSLPPSNEPQRIKLGEFYLGGNASVSTKDLTKHVLITGFTGSGKTNTVLNLLHQLWQHEKIPFLVIESAKQEYRGLIGVECFKDHKNLRVYTLGNETCAPLRINPFQLLPGMRLEAHIGRLITCFLAVLPPIGPLPSILAEAIEIIYQKKGWMLTSVGAKDDPRHFPTIRDLFNEIEAVVNERGYAGEVRSNVMAATKGRLKVLLMGSLGYMFSAERNFNLDELFQYPTILELNDLNPDDKSLVMMFLLVILREYRDQHRAKKLQHVTVVEEAHNVLAKAESQGSEDGGGADTKAKSVEAFSNMLAEVRALGEGLIIADQSPNKLAPDAMRNTNVQIAHQLRDGHDRDAIANAMIMDDEQRDFLGKLEPGRAAVFYTGLQKATFMRVPEYYPSSTQLGSYPGLGFREDVTDKEIARYMNSLTEKYRKPELPYPGCEHCESQCRYLDKVKEIIDDEPHRIQFKKLHASRKGEGFKELVNGCKIAASEVGGLTSVDAAWCILVHVTIQNSSHDTRLPKEVRRTFKAFY